MRRESVWMRSEYKVRVKGYGAARGAVQGRRKTGIVRGCNQEEGMQGESNIKVHIQEVCHRAHARTASGLGGLRCWYDGS